VRRILRLQLSRLHPDHLVVVLDLAGTFLFAAQGANLAIAAHFDLLGIAVIAFVSALGGGMIRDVMIGDAPPAAINDWRYALVALVAGVVTFFTYGYLRLASGPLFLTVDAAGLAIFSIAGARKALDFGLNPLAAILMAGVTASGGGVMRDVLLNRIPDVLHTDFYATAALAGGATMIAARRIGLPPGPAALMGIAVCFGLRMAGAILHWGLPKLGY
jgi:uncharacterized membrane protein YeiH